MGGSGSGSGSGFRQHRRGGRGPDFGQDSAGVRHPRSERRPAILAFARCGVAAAVLLSCCVPAWGAVKGMRDVKEMGATRGSKIPDMEALAKHPYGHGPNQKALLDTRILDEVFLMDSQGSQQGEKLPPCSNKPPAFALSRLVESADVSIRVISRGRPRPPAPAPSSTSTSTPTSTSLLHHHHLLLPKADVCLGDPNSFCLLQGPRRIPRRC